MTTIARAAALHRPGIGEALGMTERIARALHALAVPGSFAARVRASADDLELLVNKVGPVPRPITATAVRRLLTVASPSPIGLREQTIFDPRVRSGREIRRSRVKINGKRWNPVLRRHLETVRKKLGLPETARLNARLDKLTVYGPGEFFRRHQDTERDERMIGTLVVLLPSAFTGGAIRIERGDEHVEYRRTRAAASGLELIAFYADCRHEIRPVNSGYRVALVYQLAVDDTASADITIPARQLDELRQAVDAHFREPRPRRRWGGETFIPQKLICLLDHEYTPQNLDWSLLKHGDTLRAAALREVAAALELDVFLALADLHETWQCEPRRSYRRWPRRGRWYSESPGGGDDDDITLGYLVESDLELAHWRDHSGAPREFGDMPVADAELCAQSETSTIEPHRTEYEPYMGNYGETLDRWYHHAALVLWPRHHAFAIRARIAPREAIRALIRDTRSGDGATTEKLERLLAIWPECAGGQEDARLMLDTLRLAAALDDRDQVERLLAPLKIKAAPVSAVKSLLAVARRHGLETCKRALEAWHGGAHSRRTSWCSAYVDTWLRRLVAGEDADAVELARFIVARQWDELRASLSTPARRRSPFAEQRRTARIDEVVALLRACRITGAGDVHRAATALLASPDTPLSSIEGAEALATAAGEMSKDERAWPLAAPLAYFARMLEDELARPARDDDDWSIEAPRWCSCEDCTTLDRFLRSREATLDWPLREDRRRHIGETIERLQLPVAHATRRVGSPYRLELKKRDELFTIDARTRRAREQALDAIRRATPSGAPAVAAGPPRLRIVR